MGGDDPADIQVHVAVESREGVLRRYVGKMTGYSPAQLSRLIAQYRSTYRVRLPEYRRHRFPTKYTREDQALLAEVDNAHDLKEILVQYPFRILGFHADNGSECINHVVAGLLEKLQIELTKSRARQTNDQALVEGKNGSIVRKQMGYGWIAQEEAEKIQAFYKRVLNVYLNYHRPCGYATEFVDRKGKVRKPYNAYLTPYEKLKSLPQAEQYVHSLG